MIIRLFCVLCDSVLALKLFTVFILPLFHSSSSSLALSLPPAMKVQCDISVVGY